MRLIDTAKIVDIHNNEYMGKHIAQFRRWNNTPRAAVAKSLHVPVDKIAAIEEGHLINNKLMMKEARAVGIGDTHFINMVHRANKLASDKPSEQKSAKPSTKASNADVKPSGSELSRQQRNEQHVPSNGAVISEAEATPSPTDLIGDRPKTPGQMLYQIVKSMIKNSSEITGQGLAKKIHRHSQFFNYGSYDMPAYLFTKIMHVLRIPQRDIITNLKSVGISLDDNNIYEATDKYQIIHGLSKSEMVKQAGISWTIYEELENHKWISPHMRARIKHNLHLVTDSLGDLDKIKNGTHSYKRRGTSYRKTAFTKVINKYGFKSVSALARAANMSQGNLSRIKNHYVNPSEGTVQHLANVMNAPYNEVASAFPKVVTSKRPVKSIKYDKKPVHNNGKPAMVKTAKPKLNHQQVQAIINEATAPINKSYHNLQSKLTGLESQITDLKHDKKTLQSKERFKTSNSAVNKAQLANWISSTVKNAMHSQNTMNSKDLKLINALHTWFNSYSKSKDILRGLMHANSAQLGVVLAMVHTWEAADK